MGLDKCLTFLLEKLKNFSLYSPFFSEVGIWFSVYLCANITVVILEGYGVLGLSIIYLSFAHGWFYLCMLNVSK